MADVVTTVAAVPAIPATPAGAKAKLEEHVARLQAAFARALTEEDITTIARTLIDQARQGDKTAARLVLKYGLGSMISLAVKSEEKAETRAAIQAVMNTSDEMMARIHQRMAEQAALEAEIRGQGRPSAASRPPQAGPGRPGR